MTKDDGKQPAEQPISDYAPPQRPVSVVEPTNNSGAGRVYLTAEMIAPDGEIGDAMRLTRITGPALDQIGRSTADQVDLQAQSIVDNARRGAETLLAEAQVQAADMIARAEAVAAEMTTFSKSMRAHTDRQAFQVNQFCNIAESVLGTMHAFKSQFQTMTEEEARTEAKAKAGEGEDGEVLELPDWVGRKKK